jgi:hypothetical protein
VGIIKFVIFSRNQLSKCVTFDYYPLVILDRSKTIKILGDQNDCMATMYENLCGNCVGRIELTTILKIIK